MRTFWNREEDRERERERKREIERRRRYLRIFKKWFWWQSCRRSDSSITFRLLDRHLSCSKRASKQQKSRRRSRIFFWKIFQQFHLPLYCECVVTKNGIQLGRETSTTTTTTTFLFGDVFWKKKVLKRRWRRKNANFSVFVGSGNHFLSRHFVLGSFVTNYDIDVVHIWSAFSTSVSSFFKNVLFEMASSLGMSLSFVVKWQKCLKNSFDVLKDVVVQNDVFHDENEKLWKGRTNAAKLFMPKPARTLVGYLWVDFNISISHR